MPESLSVPDMERARSELDGVPGGTTLVGEGTMRRGTTGDLAEALATAPGLFIRSRYGGDEVRLSIRGSGLTQTFGVRGVRLLRDGMPVTGAGGFGNPELVDFAGARYAEIYRGANALRFGGADLGGAINLVSHTGHSADRLRARGEIGGHGYRRLQLTGGGVRSALDAFAAVSAIRQDGFRAHAEQDGARAYANLGWRWNARHESRLHLTAQRTRLQLPGSLTLAQLQDDPAQANALWTNHGAARDLDHGRLAWHHGVGLGVGRIYLGVWAGRTTMDHPLPFSVIDSDTDGYGAHLRHETTSTLAGREHRWVWGVQAAFEDSQGRQFAPAGGGRRGALRQHNRSKAYSVEVHAESRWQVSERLNLVSGVQAAFARRQARIDFTAPAVPGVDDGQHYSGTSPKLGLVWRLRPGLRLFTNFSASFEPPSLQEFRNENDPDPAARATLRAQRALTLEFGGRGEWGVLAWEASLYHARIEREILQQETFPGSGQGFVTNAGRTHHQGAEAGLSGELPLVGGDALNWHVHWTYNRFRFDSDPQFGDNRLPGIPRNLGRIEVEYRHRSGFHAGPLFEAASATPVDFANTLEAPGYGIWGVRAGYEFGPVRFFVEARNLADKAYVSNTGVTVNTTGTDGAYFNPGLTRTLFVGIEFSEQVW